MTNSTSDVIAILEEWLEDAKSGQVITIGVIGQRAGGEWQTCFSSSDAEDAVELMQLGMQSLKLVKT